MAAEEKQESEDKKEDGPLCKNCYFLESEHKTGRDNKLHCKGGEFSTSYEALDNPQFVGSKHKG